MIKHLPYNGKSWLLNYLTNSVKLGLYQHNGIVAIPKAGRDNHPVAVHRPISMMSCMCKVFPSTYILKNRIEWFFDRNSILPRSSLGNLGALVAKS